jgi:hypothetical protein
MLIERNPHPLCGIRTTFAKVSPSTIFFCSSGNRFRRLNSIGPTDARTASQAYGRSLKSSSHAQKNEKDAAPRSDIGGSSAGISSVLH